MHCYNTLEECLGSCSRIGFQPVGFAIDRLEAYPTPILRLILTYANQRLDLALGKTALSKKDSDSLTFIDSH